ncbi:hypothetical protein AVL62_15000 [Serinicoccus chungangensis]|uniref:Uncharacterized protein n=1 Tax=Serinicoccus chungangensis TaxID=767452 RepID=A0A0W8IAU7_9MICO|nr:LamG domain-containing protein [Serinicoccus chungangensis]KUG57099.1 hypothetical protein AVL62_15000 [Serinicoccus chungangensis]
MSGLSNIGTLPVTVDVAKLDGGTARVDRDRAGDVAVRLPAFQQGSSMPRAVVRVRHQARSGDPLAPGTKDFAFGASFNLDRVSTGSKIDNGNNIMQRGTWGESQYKLQVDDDRLTCRVSGSRGAVFVRSWVTVQPGRWYDATCERSGTAVTLTVTEHLAGDKTRIGTSTGRGATGHLSWSNRSTPLSIGGKLTASGQVVKGSTDQFNGVVSDPMLDIDN